jgi:hypothetical protein
MLEIEVVLHLQIEESLMIQVLDNNFLLEKHMSDTIYFLWEKGFWVLKTPFFINCQASFQLMSHAIKAALILNAESLTVKNQRRQT